MTKKATKYEGQWVTVEVIDGWYEYARDSNSRGIVYILPYKITPEGFEVLGRYENTPCHEDGITLTSITGGIPMQETPIDAAVRETYEEAGYTVVPGDFDFLGDMRPSKMLSTRAYMYMVNVTDISPDKPKGDGTKGESDAYVQWITPEEAVMCKEPMMSAMVLRAARIIMTRALKNAIAKG